MAYILCSTAAWMWWTTQTVRGKWSRHDGKQADHQFNAMLMVMWTTNAFTLPTHCRDVKRNHQPSMTTITPVYKPVLSIKEWLCSWTVINRCGTTPNKSGQACRHILSVQNNIPHAGRDHVCEAPRALKFWCSACRKHGHPIVMGLDCVLSLLLRPLSPYPR